MSISNEEDYMRLRARLIIDPLMLDDELIHMPMLIMEASEHAMNAIHKRDEAKAVLEWTRANVAASLRADTSVKRTDASVAADIQLDADYGRAQDELLAWGHDASLWQALVDALREKSRSLNKTADLMLSGYLTPSAAQAERRGAIAEKRQELRQKRTIARQE